MTWNLVDVSVPDVDNKPNSASVEFLAGAGGKLRDSPARGSKAQSFMSCAENSRVQQSSRGHPLMGFLLLPMQAVKVKSSAGPQSLDKFIRPDLNFGSNRGG